MFNFNKHLYFVNSKKNIHHTTTKVSYFLFIILNHHTIFIHPQNNQQTVKVCKFLFSIPTNEKFMLLKQTKSFKLPMKLAIVLNCKSSFKRA